MRFELSALAAPVAAQDPYSRPDDSWISLSGTVGNPTADSFTLDYGDGVITVEMDDWDSYGDAYGLMDGDRVTVYGDIDENLFTMTTIEASSVYVEGLNTYFYASSADEEEAYTWIMSTPIVIGEVTLRGTVSDLDAEAQEFTLDTGGQVLTIDTAFLTYNPLDDVGYAQPCHKADLGSGGFRRLAADLRVVALRGRDRLGRSGKAAARHAAGHRPEAPPLAARVRGSNANDCLRLRVRPRMGPDAPDTAPCLETDRGRGVSVMNGARKRFVSRSPVPTPMVSQQRQSRPVPRRPPVSFRFRKRSLRQPCPQRGAAAPAPCRTRVDIVSRDRGRIPPGFSPSGLRGLRLS